MFNKKPRSSETVDTPAKKSKQDVLHDSALNWESSRIEQIERSERRAWRIAMISVLASAGLVVAIVLMMPLKENTPYVVRVDNATGIPDIITSLDSKGVSVDEVMDKYWLAQYVRAHDRL